MENRGRKLAEATRTRIGQLLAQGMSVRKVAKAMYVSPSTVQRIRGEALTADSSCAQASKVRCARGEDAVMKKCRNDVATKAKTCLTKRTGFSSNTAARLGNDRARPRGFAATLVAKVQAYMPVERVFPRLRCGLVWCVSMVRRIREIWLTKRTEFSSNTGAMIEKPPDRLPHS
ncbi:helix-turn-helix domain-containing protein [Blastopirellula retiformator]|uniref:Helix-turn-helix domain of resolvase n=1 Tax=Blastopirellula retiformator TaxID=2527970 RepID=A0A5C5V8U3_9BACT|nr:helix-turn-helix domain-containing protein [Blastopirellula retiformator]TWT34701.1 Helix-turn-helix domain of resolvase [Blastopirellula retiformator]